MKVADFVYSRKFFGDKPKDAYIASTDWVAKVLIARNSPLNNEHIVWNIHNVSDGGKPCFEIKVYVQFDEEENNERFCKICKEMHNSFFSNTNYNCDKCNKESYRKKLQKSLDVSIEKYKEDISNALSKF